jgi:hypothetical protein
VVTRLVERDVERALHGPGLIHIVGAPRTGKTALMQRVAARHGQSILDCRDARVVAILARRDRAAPPAWRGRMVLDHVDVLRGGAASLLDGLGRHAWLKDAVLIGREPLPCAAATVRIHPLSEAERERVAPTFIARLFAAVFPRRIRPATTGAAIAGRIIAGGFPELEQQSIHDAHRWLESYAVKHPAQLTHMPIDVWSPAGPGRPRWSWIHAGLECAASGVTWASLQRSPALLEAVLGTWLICELTAQAQVHHEPTRVLFAGPDLDLPVAYVESPRGGIAFVCCVASAGRLPAARRALDDCRRAAGCRFATAVALHFGERCSAWAPRCYELPISMVWEAH